MVRVVNAFWEWRENNQSRSGFEFFMWGGEAVNFTAFDHPEPPGVEKNSCGRKLLRNLEVTADADP